jgi:hypothetical protein
VRRVAPAHARAPASTAMRAPASTSMRVLAFTAMRAPAATLALALAVTLGGCESTQEQSAKLERLAKREAGAGAHSRALAPRNLSIARPSSIVEVLGASVVHSSEGAAVSVTLRNTSATALSDMPIEIVVKDAHGASLYTNATPGLASSLVSVPLLGAHATSTWVDDQVQLSATPASVAAKVGEGRRVSAAIPQLAVRGARLSEGEAEGTVANRSSSAQSEVIVYAVARRGRRVVAAGRAVVHALGAGASADFQVFLIGNAAGAQLQVSASPSTLG